MSGSNLARRLSVALSIYKREFLSADIRKAHLMNGHLPPLSALRAFEATARLKSFGKAADELNVTPAAISHQIHALEADLGVRLFHRLNRAIELTASARVLLPGLSDAFAGIQDSVRRLRAHNDTGTLTVTASPVDRRQVARPAASPLSGAPPRYRCADLDLGRNRRPDQGRFRHRDPLWQRALSRARGRAIDAERGVSGVQPAPPSSRAAAAHARGSASTMR